MAFLRVLCLMVFFVNMYYCSLGELRPSMKKTADLARFRTKRSAENGAQLPESACEGCSGSFTPYFSGQCVVCPAGTPGPMGPPGAQGLPGRDGRDGRDAPIGVERQELEEGPDNTNPDNTSGGAVYVRWGRDVCPSNSVLVYSGVAGGSHYSHSGGASNYLCMPQEPIYDNPMAGRSGQSRGYVFGSEFQTDTFAPLNAIHDHDVPCAVCLASTRQSLLMIPARNICPEDGWVKEYSGYLMAGKYDHASRNEFVCMDRDPQIVPRTSFNANGALFYPVDGRCGENENGLPCGPYVDGYELTCAVCTR